MEWFESIEKFLLQNIQWIFSGIGVVIVSGIFKMLRKKEKSSAQIQMKQKSGKNSSNIQIGGDYNKYGR